MDDFAFSLANEEIMEIATNFVEKYADFVENLPFDLQRQVSRLREIDWTCRELLTEIEGLYTNFTKEKDLNMIKKSCHVLIRMQCLFGRCQELGDEKIKIVQQITELIENKKKGVEHSSHKFKAIFRPDQKAEYNGKRESNKHDQKNSKRPRRNKQPNYNGKHEKVKMTMADPMAASSYSRFSISDVGDAQSSGDKPRSSLTLESTVTKNSKVILDDSLIARKAEKLEKKEASPASSVSSGSSVASPTTLAGSQRLSLSKSSSAKTNLPTSKVTVPSNNSNGSNKTALKGKRKKKRIFKPIEKPSTRSPSPQGDLPIDPDEPTYCICEQVSFGQMIGCDNKKCPIEWFHFSCVGLTHKPKGKWFCPKCSRDRKKEAKKEHR